MPVRLTHIGGPTLLVEAHGWRILSDPTFDPPGRRYGFGWGTSSVKITGPAVPAKEVGPLDVVLLSHVHHADNLDDTGRALLPGARSVVTTPSGAKRLAAANMQGLAPWATTTLSAPGLPDLTITATPCRHGPPLSRPIDNGRAERGCRAPSPPGSPFRGRVGYPPARTTSSAASRASADLRPAAACRRRTDLLRVQAVNATPRPVLVMVS